MTIAEGGANAISVERAVFPAGFRGTWHTHPAAQLIYPSRGVMILETAAGCWVVPPQQACWLPSDEDHRVQTSAGFEMLSVYCRGSVLRRLPVAPGVVAVSGLLRECIFALEKDVQRSRRVSLAILFSQEVSVEIAPALFVPQLRSSRLRKIEAALSREPGNDKPLSEWANDLGASSRTLARAFEREANMTFTAYRKQTRLRAALVRLAEGESVTNIALDLSFGSASNFIRMFRQATGFTPGKYFQSSPERDRR